MSSTPSGNKLLIGLGVTTAIVGAAVIFHLLTNKVSNASAIFEEIDALGAPKREMNGFLSFTYYKDLFILI